MGCGFRVCLMKCEAGNPNMGCGFRVSARDPPCILVFSPVRKSVQFFLEQIALCVLRYPPWYLSVNFLRFAKLSTFFLLGLRYVVVAYPHLNPTVHFLRFKKWTLRNSEVSTFLTLCRSSVSPSKSDCPLFEIQKVDSWKFGSVHFSDATLERKKWTVGNSEVSTFLTLPV